MKRLFVIGLIAVSVVLFACRPLIRVKNDTSSEYDYHVDGVNIQHQYTLNGTLFGVLNLDAGDKTRYKLCDPGDTLMVEVKTTYMFEDSTNVTFEATDADGNSIEIKRWRRYTYHLNEEPYEDPHNVTKPSPGYLTVDADTYLE